MLCLFQLMINCCLEWPTLQPGGSDSSQWAASICTPTLELPKCPGAQLEQFLKMKITTCLRAQFCSMTLGAFAQIPTEACHRLHMALSSATHLRNTSGPTGSKSLSERILCLFARVSQQRHQAGLAYIAHLLPSQGLIRMLLTIRKTLIQTVLNDKKSYSLT